MIEMVSVQYLLVTWIMHLIIFSLLEFDPKKEIRLLNLGIFMGFAVLDLLSYGQTGAHQLQLYHMILEVVAVVLVMLYALQGYQKISMWVLVIVSLLVTHFTSIMTAGFLLTMGGIHSREMLNNNPLVSLVGLISGLICFQIFYLIIKRFNLKLNVTSLSKKNVLTIILFLVIFGFYFSFYINNLRIIINEYVANLKMLINILSFLIGILPLCGIVYLMNQKDHIRYIETREKKQALLFEEERLSYQKMDERNEEVSVFKHDIDDELDYIYQLAQNNDSKEISAYIAKMKATTTQMVKSTGQYTGTMATNASWYALISNEKYAQVQHEWLGKLPPNMRMDNRDMVRLFSNLFKNAFEAAVQSKTDKYVKVKVVVDRNRLLITVRNSYAHDIKVSHDVILETTKLKKEVHGIGTRVIKEIVDAYDGKIKYDYDGQEFVASVAFGARIYQS